MTSTESQEVEISKRDKSERIECDWTSLPTDILGHILSNFHVIGDINKFRAVCKAWQFIEHTKEPIGFGSQWLAKKQRDESTITLFHPYLCQAYYMDISELRGACIRFSKDGWVLMSRGCHETFFLHLFTKSKIKLPDLPSKYAFNGITFTSNPTAEDCVVFGIAECLGLDVEIYSISHGQEKWSRVKIFVDPSEHPGLYLSHSNPVYHKGKFYTLAKYGQLGVFDPNDNSWSVVYPHEFTRVWYENYLLDFNGDLVSVFVAHMGGCISMFKWDESGSNWMYVDDLGEHMLFLSETTSFSKKKLKNCMKNKIYFPRLHDKYEVFYDMKDESYQTFGNNFQERDLYDTKLQLECSWIELTKEIGGKLVDWFEK